MDVDQEGEEGVQKEEEEEEESPNLAPEVY